jgi:Filamin/ABP280 repeat
MTACFSFTDSVGPNAFSVSITKSADQSGVRAWIQVLDRQDGSYIVRYKLVESPKDLSLSIFYNNQQVANSPYFLKGL